jgi:hypothetical protein
MNLLKDGRIVVPRESPWPLCATCGDLATCRGGGIGDRDDDEGGNPFETYACDTCCGHDDEDGTYCNPLVRQGMATHIT